MRIALWEFPADDHAAWQELTGDTMSLHHYREVLAAVQADQERQGREVVRVQMTVAEMQTALIERGLENTTANRAVIIGLAQ